MEDDELIELLKNKNELAYKMLVKNYKNLIANAAYKFFFNLQDAEDIAQDVFLEIYNSINKYNKKSKFSSWIYRITVSKSIDKIRKRKRKKRIQKVISIFSEDFASHENKVIDYGDPYQLMEDKESCDSILKTIDRLPENQRIAITLYKINSLSLQETAEIMQTTTGAIEALVFRARQKLKKMLNESYEN